MSDRIAVFNHGRIEQTGEPAEVYDRPASEFVAAFVGTSNIVERGGHRVCIRPERIALGNGGEPATVDDVVFVGAFTRYLVLTDKGERLTIVQQNDSPGLEPGARVHVSWHDADAYEIQPPNTLQQEVR